ncbi:MAG: 4'-phosphopantetheinyl transferase superfamily protein [Cyanobacteria bacterium P01_H01_bin.152]
MSVSRLLAIAPTGVQPSVNLTVPQARVLPNSKTVHVWQLQCSALQLVKSYWQTWLAPDEVDRLQQYQRPADRDRFICSRGGLRYLLAGYLGQPPAAIRLGYGAYGRPHLLSNPAPLQFNIAHSGDWVIIGFSRCAYTGVDVEVLQPRQRLQSLIQRCLTPEEQAALALDATTQLTHFLQYWTLKEAHLKALGLGLSYPLQQVQVTLQPKPAIICPAHLPDSSLTDWYVELWQPDPQAIAAVCIGQAACNIQLFDLATTATVSDRQHSGV